MRKELAVGEIAYNLKGKAFCVIEATDGRLCDPCHFGQLGLGGCRNFTCGSSERQDEKEVFFQRRDASAWLIAQIE